MIAWWILDWIYLMIAWNSYHMHHIEIILGKRSNFLPKIKIPLALDIKNWGFQLKRAGGGSRDKKMQKFWKNWPLTMTIDRWPSGRPVKEPIDRFVEVGNLKSPPTLHFSPAFLHSLKLLYIHASISHFWPDFGPIASCGLDFGTPWG